jgi:two-component system, chemotaxis family, CheB/CheR fusion protein
MTPRELEVQDRHGKWYSLRIRPYKNVDNRIDGAVLTLMDIGAVKRYQEQLERSQSHLLETVDLMHEPVLILNEEFRVAAANPAFYRMFELSENETVGMPVFDLSNKEWNIPRLRTLLQQLLSAEDGVENVSLDYSSRSRGLQRLMVSGRRISLGETKYWCVLTVGAAHAEGRA